MEYNHELDAIQYANIHSSIDYNLLGEVFDNKQAAYQHYIHMLDQHI